MHRGGGTQEGGKAGTLGGRGGYQRDYRQATGYTDNRRQEKLDSHAEAEANHAQAMLVTLDKRISTMQEDFTAELRKISGKENEKFDLIFAILSELQSRQAQLEESVRSLKAGYNNGCGGALQQPAQTQQGQQQQPQVQQQGQQGGQLQGQQQTAQSQYSGRSASGQYSQVNTQMQGQMNGQMNSQMNNQISGQMNNQMNNQMNGQMNMQQQFGMMHSGDSQAVFAAMPQVIVVSSPGAGMQQMQYAVPQMMTPTNGMQMQQQMAMQFVGQGQGDDYQWAGDESIPAGAGGGQLTSPKNMTNQPQVVEDDAKAVAVEADDEDRPGSVEHEG